MSRDMGSGGAGNEIAVGTFAVSGSDVTICSWVNVDSMTPSRDDRYLMKGSGSAANQHDFMIGKTGNPPIARCRFGLVTQTLVGTTTLPTSTWFQIAATYDSATGFSELFYNGSSEGTNSGHGSGGLASNANPVFIGNGPASSSNDPDGRLAEVAIWNAKLDNAEISALAAGFSPALIRPQNLVHYWPLLGNYSPEIDLVGGQAGTLTGTTKAAHPRVILPPRPALITAPVAAVGGTTPKGVFGMPLHGPFGGPI